LLPPFVITEFTDGDGWQREHPSTSLRLQFDKLELSIDPLELPRHHECAQFQIDVVPAQTEGFALTEAYCQGNRIKGAQAIALGGVKEPPSLLDVKGMWFIWLNPRSVDHSCRVSRDVAPADRMIEGGPQGSS
jgi:hypothetical protein